MIISGKVVVLIFIIVGMLALIAAFLICFIEDKEVNKDKNGKKENIKQVDMKGALKYFKIINK